MIDGERNQRGESVYGFALKPRRPPPRVYRGQRGWRRLAQRSVATLGLDLPIAIILKKKNLPSYLSLGQPKAAVLPSYHILTINYQQKMIYLK